jgi:hypothetical protein
MMYLWPSYGGVSMQDGTILRRDIETWRMSGCFTIIPVDNPWYWLKRVSDEFAASEIDPETT